MSFASSGSGKVYGVLRGTIKFIRGQDVDNNLEAHFNYAVDADQYYQVNMDIHGVNNEDVTMVSFTDFGQASTGDESNDSELLSRFDNIATGFTPLQSQPGGLALDLIRHPLFNIDDFNTQGGQSTDELTERLNNILSDGQEVIVFGTMWGGQGDGGERHERWHDHDSRHEHHHERHHDHYNEGEGERGQDYVNWNDINVGVDDVHLNQGTQGNFPDNGIYQDGALFAKMEDGSWTAAFFRFQGQCLKTDDNGNCVS